MSTRDTNQAAHDWTLPNHETTARQDPASPAGVTVTREQLLRACGNAGIPHTTALRIMAYLPPMPANSPESAEQIVGHPASSDNTELIELLYSLKPNYGAVGSRDVDVTAQRKRIDLAIQRLQGGQ